MVWTDSSHLASHTEWSYHPPHYTLNISYDESDTSRIFNDIYHATVTLYRIPKHTFRIASLKNPVSFSLRNNIQRWINRPNEIMLQSCARKRAAYASKLLTFLVLESAWRIDKSVTLTSGQIESFQNRERDRRLSPLLDSAERKNLWKKLMKAHYSLWHPTSLQYFNRLYGNDHTLLTCRKH